jgi:hypothetical protein
LYAAGFFFFWSIAALSSFVTIFLATKDKKEADPANF